MCLIFLFFFQAEDGIRDHCVTGVQTCALPIFSVSLPLEREVTDYQNFTGRNEAIRMVQLRARVTGYLDKVNFKDGDLVKEKDVLGEIDSRVYQAAFEQAEANVAQYEARVFRMQVDYERAHGLFTK